MRIAFPRSIGMILLAVYLILVGLTAFISIGQLASLLGLLALIAGILLLLGL